MIAAIKEVFVRSARFAWLCPLLFAVPLAAEFAQHVVEVRIGLYADIASAQAHEGDSLRMGFGYVKVLALFAVGYWVVRFLAHGDDPREARRLDPVALRLFSWVAFYALVTSVIQFSLPYLGFERGVLMGATGVVMLVSLTLEFCLSGWKAAAALGNPRIGFLRSLRMIRGSFWWACGLFVLTVMPLLVAHYVAFALALGAGPGKLWSVMVLDSLLTAYLGVVIAANCYLVARRMADRHGETLLPTANAALTPATVSLR